MRKLFKILLGAALAVVLLFAFVQHQVARWYAEENPNLWLPQIWAFEAADRKNGYPGNAVVFVGSSSIRFWDSLAADMAPVPVIRRGFGGSRLAAATHYAPRIVTKYEPAAVVLFSGTNDITPERSKTAREMLALYVDFVERVHALQPGVPIYYIAITPSPKRWSVWEVARDANRLITAFAAANPLLQVIDTSVVLLGDDGRPRPEMYREDRLHLSAAGYRAWTAAIRPHLLRYATPTSVE